MVLTPLTPTPLPKGEGFKSRLSLRILDFLNRYKIFLLFLFILVLCFFIFFASSHRVEKTIIPLSSQEGAEIFMHSQHANYWRLAQYYVTQKNLYFCGVASIVMVLNALDIPAPQLFPDEKYHMFTQDNFFSLKKIKNVLNEDDVAWMGMKFEDIPKVFKAFPLNIQVVDAADYSFLLFHQALMSALSRDQHYLIACYNRKLLHQPKKRSSKFPGPIMFDHEARAILY